METKRVRKAYCKFLGDPTLTTAILDRLLYLCEILTFKEDQDCKHFFNVLAILLNATHCFSR
ncbi:ATP-binding protein [Alkalihalobacillus sp. MEB130]|nr:ATP-binding protein [Alkalihalobacillus sp. MEB130]